jgi:hypothetical protein
MEDLSIPCVARFVTQPTALHWTSTLGLSIWRMRGSRPPSLTIRSLLSAEGIDQGLSSQHRLGIRTVDGKVSEGGASGTLNFGVMAAEEEENWIEGFAADRSNLLLGDFCKCESGAPLKVNIVGKRECCQRGQWGAREEVGIRAIWGQ